MNRLLAVAAVAATTFAASASADPVADFYKGKTLFLQIGSETGGGYDLVGRLVAPYLVKHIPGRPKVVVQNVIGGGSLVLANQFANTTVRDGSYIGLFSTGMPTTPLVDPDAAHFDPRKFHFIGSPSTEVEVMVVWHGAHVKTIEDALTKPLIVGASSPGSATLDFPLAINALYGTKFKIVAGYKGATEVKLAMQRGEVEANVALAWGSAKTQYADLLKSKQLLVVAQFAHKHPDLPDVPLWPEAKTEEGRQIMNILYARGDYGRPFATPPDVPADRVKALRAAFDATMKDPGFLAAAKKVKLDILPLSGEEIQKITDRLYQTKPEVIARLREVLGTKVETRKKKKK